MPADWRILVGDVRERLRTIAANSVQCVVTSPPYWGLRAYGTEPQVWGGRLDCDHRWACGTCSKCGAWLGELGQEPTPQLFVANMVDVFREVRRVIRPDGVLWLNIGDTYATGAGSSRQPGGVNSGKHRPVIQGGSYPGSQPNRTKQPGLKPKDRVGIPHMLAFALRDDGWFFRDEIIWHKPNPMPTSTTDRTCPAHEFVFLMTKSARYFYDQIATHEPASYGSHSRGKGVNPKAAANAAGSRQNASFSAAVKDLVETRNKRSVWTISTHSFKGAHFATFPPALVAECIKAGTSERGCCPECGRPWVRRTESERVPTRPAKDSKVHRASQHPESNGSIVGNRDPLRHVTRTRTIGWEPGCTCFDPDTLNGTPMPVPCVVLDVFAGSGTTLLVANELGRSAIGIELNAEYAAMANERVSAGLPKKARKRKAVTS